MDRLITRPIRPGDRLPPMELSAAPDGKLLRVQTQTRDAIVLLLVPARSDAWKEYVSVLAEAAPDIEQWYARILVVISAGLNEAGRLREYVDGRLTVLADPGAGTHRQSGLDAKRAALLIVDRYGEVYDAVDAAHPGQLPTVADVEEWAKFLATQCPECGVIDEPGYGEWALT